jgi:hypothetical protein
MARFIGHPGYSQSSIVFSSNRKWIRAAIEVRSSPATRLYDGAVCSRGSIVLAYNGEELVAVTRKIA